MITKYVSQRDTEDYESFTYLLLVAPSFVCVCACHHSIGERWLQREGRLLEGCVFFLVRRYLLILPLKLSEVLSGAVQL